MSILIFMIYHMKSGRDYLRENADPRDGKVMLQSELLILKRKCVSTGELRRIFVWYCFRPDDN